MFKTNQVVDPDATTEVEILALDVDTLPILPTRRQRSSGFEKHTMRLTIDGETNEYILAEDQTLTIGRAEHPDSPQPDFDLSPYDAAEKGVSRQHLQFHVYRGCPYVTDLGSRNGTYLNYKRLAPHDPEMIDDGDTLVLGHLVMRIELA